MTEKAKTKSQEVAADVSALFRARNPLLWVVTREEARVEQYLFEAAALAGYTARTWDVAQGVRTMTGEREQFGGQDPGETLAAIDARSAKGDRGVFIMRDLPAWLSGPAGATTQRQLRNLARKVPTMAKESSQAVVVLSPNGEVPPELQGHATVIEWPLPDRAEIAAMLDVLIEQYDLKDMLVNGKREAAIDAAVGLSGEEAQACYSRSLVKLRTVEPAVVSQEKRRVIARERVLEWYDPLPGGLASVGGLDNLKNWLMSRVAAYSPQARAYGLQPPKGVMVVGVSGCGKTMMAKATATAYGIPLLRVDLGALKSKFVGESEGNLRKAFRVIEAIGRCVVWFDEVEKMLQGATSGSADGGVSSDALGAVLTWMQERRGEAFVVATANDIEGLPPEFLRKGRFDEIFWVDLPNVEEREAVLTATLRTVGRDPDALDVQAAFVAKQCDGFTGAEIAAIVPDAMFTAFGDGAREIDTDDLVQAAATVVPLSKTAAEKIAKLREWARGRARPATLTAPAKVKQSKRERVLDI